MPDTKSLVHLSAQVSDLEQALVQNDGVLPPELEAHFDLTTGELAEKIDRYKYVIDAFDARAAYFKKLEADMKHARKLFEAQIERLKGRLKYVMNASGEKELVGRDWRFVVSNAKEKLVLSGDVPDEYMKEVVTREPDRGTIETALKMGFEIEGCTLEPSQSLRVYVNARTESRPAKELEDGK